MLELLEALFYVHLAFGVVHNSLKPENIYINFSKGNASKKISVKLGDFSLATPLGSF
jgi:serine/threonine protein kinase